MGHDHLHAVVNDRVGCFLSIIYSVKVPRHLEDIIKSDLAAEGKSTEPPLPQGRYTVGERSFSLATASRHYVPMRGRYRSSNAGVLRLLHGGPMEKEDLPARPRCRQ